MTKDAPKLQALENYMMCRYHDTQASCMRIYMTILFKLCRAATISWQKFVYMKIEAATHLVHLQGDSVMCNGLVKCLVSVSSSMWSLSLLKLHVGKTLSNSLFLNLHGGTNNDESETLGDTVMVSPSHHRCLQ